MAFTALVAGGCAHTTPLPMPSDFREASHGRVTSPDDLDRMRLLEGSARNPLRVGREQEEVPAYPWTNLVRLPPFVRSVVGLADGARRGGRYDEVIRLADSAVGAADHAIISRTEREHVRFGAWRLSAGAWSALGYPGRARVVATMAALAEHYGRSAEARRSTNALNEQLSALDEAVLARNEAAGAADSAANTAALGGYLRAATSTLSSATSGTPMTIESMASLTREVATTMGEVEAAGREAAGIVQDTDREIGSYSAAQAEALSLESPELAAMTTRLAASVRFYLEASQGDCGYLIAAFNQLGRETRWNPPGYDRALDQIERAVSSDGACAWRPTLQGAFNLIYLSALSTGRGRVVSEREARAFGQRPTPAVAAVPAPAPTTDGDEDGVAGALDRCPDDPEDRDGFQDQDGCPDPDNDGDGFGDAVDCCRDQPETVNGFEDRDGCPDVAVDTDGDLLVDALDRCPTEPEVYNGRTDDDGCPDRGAALFRVEGTSVAPTRPIGYRPGRPLSRRGQATLVALAALTLRSAGYRLSVGLQGDAALHEGAIAVLGAVLIAGGAPVERVLLVPMSGELDPSSRRRHRRRPSALRVGFHLERIE